MRIMRQQEAWDPFEELEALSYRMNRLLGLTRWAGSGDQASAPAIDWFPSCDITETEEAYRIRVELPNVDKDDVQVTLENSVLTVAGERRDEREEEGVQFHRRELSYGSFERRFTMPRDADESKIEATFAAGLLDVVIAKSTPTSSASKVREITVR
jgi:HSP20 family protein